MPWRENNKVEERTKFILRLRDGERIIDLCREFGISRKTGYKFLNRYKEYGLDGLYDQSRRAKRPGLKTLEEIEKLIVAMRKKYPTWGSRKLRIHLIKENPGLYIPVPSTIHSTLNRHGLIKRRRLKKRIPIFRIN